MEKAKTLIKKIQNFIQKLRKIQVILNELNIINEKLFKELKIKKAFTDNIQKLIDKHTNCLLEFLKIGKDKELEFLIVVLSQNFIEIINQGYLNTAENAIQKMEILIPEFKKTHELIKSFLFHLLSISK